MKRRMNKLVVFVVMIAIAIFIAAATETASAKDYMKTIQGDYTFTGQGVCLISPLGFTPNQAALPGYGTNTVSFQGDFTFNLDGTGVRHSLGSQIAASFNGSHAHYSTAESIAPFTYTAEPEGAIVIQSSGPYEAQFLTGCFFPGCTALIDQWSLIGHISTSTRIIALSEPIQVQTVTNPDGNQFQRACHSTYLLLPVR